MRFTGGNFTSTAANNYVLWLGPPADHPDAATVTK